MRLVSRALARAFADVFDTSTRPSQLALDTRAGTDCLTALFQARELDPDTIVVPLNERSAYDCISRAAVLAKLQDVGRRMASCSPSGSPGIEP